MQPQGTTTLRRRQPPDPRVREPARAHLFELARLLAERLELLDGLEPVEGPVQGWQRSGSHRLDELGAKLGSLRSVVV